METVMSSHLDNPMVFEFRLQHQSYVLYFKHIFDIISTVLVELTSFNMLGVIT